MTTDNHVNSETVATDANLLPVRAAGGVGDASREVSYKPKSCDCFPDQMAWLQDAIPVPGTQQTLDETLDRLFLLGGILVDSAHEVQDIADNRPTGTTIEQAVAVLSFVQDPFASGLMKDLEFLIGWLGSRRETMTPQVASPAVSNDRSATETSPTEATEQQ